MKVYFAHCIYDYDTPQEKAMIRSILNRFMALPEEVWNPKDHQPEQGLPLVDDMAHFERQIDDCDILVAFPWTGDGRFTGGVMWEIGYARAKGKRVELFKW